MALAVLILQIRCMALPLPVNVHRIVRRRFAALLGHNVNLRAKLEATAEIVFPVILKEVQDSHFMTVLAIKYNE